MCHIWRIFFLKGIDILSAKKIIQLRHLFVYLGGYEWLFFCNFWQNALCILSNESSRIKLIDSMCTWSKQFTLLSSLSNSKWWRPYDGGTECWKFIWSYFQPNRIELRSLAIPFQKHWVISNLGGRHKLLIKWFTFRYQFYRSWGWSRELWTQMRLPSQNQMHQKNLVQTWMRYYFNVRFFSSPRPHFKFSIFPIAVRVIMAEYVILQSKVWQGRI